MSGPHARTPADRRADETPKRAVPALPGAAERARPATAARAAEDETCKVACFARPAPAKRPHDPLPLRFGDWLVRRELIDRRALYAALDLCYRRSPPLRLGDALVELAVLDRNTVEEEARAFLGFTTFTVAMSHPLPPAAPAADALEQLDELERVDRGLAPREDPLERVDAAAAPAGPGRASGEPARSIAEAAAGAAAAIRRAPR